MRLSHYLRAELVIHGLEATDTSDALRQISARYHGHSGAPSTEEVFQALKAREDAHTTTLDEGVAVPHAVLPSLSEVLLMVVLAARPIPFGPPDAEGVDLFFVLLSPPGREAEHIKLLARICRLVRHPGFLEELRAAPGASELFDAIQREDSQHV
jgi:mannitol/fructose-specific phosphotransferase system IIA component (Ntr-type)